MSGRLGAIVALAALLASCSSRDDDALVASVRVLRPSVVLLTMRVPPERKADRYDDAYGTGTIVASGPWGSDILTVQHVVDGAWDMHASVRDRTKVAARTVAQDADRDLALVRTKEPDLQFARLGGSHDLADRLGVRVALVGYPIPDEFQDEGLRQAPSIDVGILSSVRNGTLEVTLPIVPGESGAPVFIADTGEIVGIADSRFDDERSIGFAVPIDEARKFLHRVDAEHGF